MSKLFICPSLVILALAALPVSAERVAVDPSIAVSAQRAVQKLGLEMMKGNFKYGQDRMYPRWKRRLAKRVGSMQQLEAQLAAADQQRIKMRLSVTAFRADLPQVFFDVWKSKKINPVTGKPVLDGSGKEIIIEHWLAIVPTTTRVKVPDQQQGGKIRVLEERSYTIAISEKGANDWYFLTGLKPTIQDLRSLFPSLPRDQKELGLPQPSAREIK
ncbi:MAG: hypothetical protein KJO79_03125 [Verrucomicrobiae bacterium]|nr:hypothetical protein [Verrucomicrobiae bacterium]NNJ86147.1 hypothetical protein [Akkermansiaceae bacterium]